MTEEDAQRSIILCAKHYQSEAKRKANWTPCVEAWLLKDRDANRKRTNGARRAPASTADAFAMAFGS
jgi:hypothetical protein